MNTSLKRTTLIFILILLMTSVIFVYNEVNSLTSYEKLIENVYSSQMETVLFSLNTFSEDYINTWINRIEKDYSIKDDSDITNLLMENKEIKQLYIFQRDSLKLLNNYSVENNTDKIKEVLSDSVINKKVNRLFTYIRAGYKKVEPVNHPLLKDNVLLISLINADNNNNYICCIILDQVRFTNSVLANKLRGILEEKYKNRFFLTVENNTTGQNVFTTNQDTLVRAEFTKKLWLMPEYSVGISLTGRTIDNVIKQRAYANFFLIALLFVTLFIGMWLIYKNVKREIELAKTKSDFVANVSHELRTPLSLITMFAETLELGRVKSESKRKEYYTIISQETNRLSKIVNKILNFSKMEAGKRTYSFDYYNLNEIAEDIYNTYNFHLKNNGFRFYLNLNDEIPFIMLDREAVSEAIINLIDNAQKYSEDIKEIIISTGFENHFVYVQVEDRGVGISEENLDKIFDKFFRVQSHLVHNTKGTGLGLAIVKHIMDAHKGEIAVKSVLWTGTSFKLLFPNQFFSEEKES